jgi:hypothetical protein
MHFRATEISFVCKTRMCAYGHTGGYGKLAGAEHGICITGMVSAGNIGTADKGHEQVVIARTFAHIAVDVYC